MLRYTNPAETIRRQKDKVPKNNFTIAKFANRGDSCLERHLIGGHRQRLRERETLG